MRTMARPARADDDKRACGNGRQMRDKDRRGCLIMEDERPVVPECACDSGQIKRSAVTRQSRHAAECLLLQFAYLLGRQTTAT